MKINTEALKFILGSKIRQLRQQLKMPLKALSEKSGLSISYLSEIEKGKKYPKPEKLFHISNALNVSFDDLVSLKTEDEGNPISAILNSPFLNELPLQEFGISMTEIFELANNAPSKASAFIQTLLEIGRNYDLQVEHFLLASLRSYQKMHLNYFADLEKQAQQFLRRRLKKQIPSPSLLEQILLNEYDVLVTYKDFSDGGELSNLRSIWIEDKHQTIVINCKLNAEQKMFELAKEIYYRIHDLQERPISSTWMQVKSFEQVHNNFSASYFAGAVLLPEKQIVADITSFLKLKNWHPQKLENIMAQYPTTPEMFLYRLSQLIPHHFGITQMHYMRIQNEPGSNSFHLTKELNTTDVFVPRGIGPHEHHCRRWASIQLLEKLAQKQAKGENPNMLIAAQRSQFHDQDGTFFNIAIARPLNIETDKNSGMTLGFRIESNFKDTAGFWNDSDLPHMQVHETCERCPLSEAACQDRAAPPSIYMAQQKQRSKAEKLKDFIQQQL
ncbi:helix-turn-helix domain-containing protein [Marinicella sp. W31]|uniref:helix-turn-helix domain-containing protein n=1 Tax=Marinicella sp. W31 TaxID=3023713 RepID=UPI0037569984